MTTNKKKLETMLEKEAYRLMDKIKVHTQSFINMYVNRKNVNIDKGVLRELTEAIGAGMEDGYLTQIEFYTQATKKSVEEYVEEHAVFELTTKKKGTSKNS